MRTQNNYFTIPNEVFQLGLSAGELAVYSYLRRCEDRRTHQCWPSYRTIGSAVGMSENTVRKYVLALEERGLIVTAEKRTAPQRKSQVHAAVHPGGSAGLLRPAAECTGGSDRAASGAEDTGGTAGRRLPVSPL